MRDLRGFRAAVRQYRRAVGRTQQQLARSIGLHPDVLSHKINGNDHAVLTTADVIGIVTTLASWGAVGTKADLLALLDLVEVPSHAIPGAAWSVPPLAGLRDAGDDVAASRPLSSAARAQTAGKSGEAPIPPDQPAAPPEPVAQRPRVTPAPLPAPATALIGRERERAVVAAAVAVSRLVTLTGAGGSGKTRLAVQAACDLASNFADGVAFIDLAPVRDSTLIATTLARELGLASASADTAEAYLKEALQDRELLLVVDNVEHLLDETEVLARIWRPTRRSGCWPPAGSPYACTASARCGFLRCTCPRRRQRRGGQRGRPVVHRAGPGGPAGLRAGQRRAGRHRRDLRGPGWPAAGHRAGRSQDPAVPAAGSAALLRSCLAVLTGGPRDAPQRQQTLRATLDWSHELLSPVGPALVHPPGGVRRAVRRRGGGCGQRER